jgi:uncharacterized protein YqjF (DUF2071 family)
MQPRRGSSEPAAGRDEAALAVVLACHHRGPLTATELALLLPGAASERTLDELVQTGLVERQGERYQPTQAGRDHLDHVLEGIESLLTPDDPAYVRRYRREAPSLPFEANTIWEEALAVNVALDPAALRPLVPGVFDLDLHEGRAFVSLTASRLKDFGVGKLPRAMRMNFYQSTYRAHITYTDFRGRKMRGCYFVRSETNSRLMSLTANLLPEFRGHQCRTYPILMARNGDHLLLTVDSEEDPAGKVVLLLDTSQPLAGMPAGSCFRTVRQAYDFLVDFYDAFAYHPDSAEVLVLQIDRGDWDIQVFEPLDHYLGFFSDGAFPPGSATLDSVFYFRNCPYRWLPLLKEKIRHENRHQGSPP